MPTWTMESHPKAAKVICTGLSLPNCRGALPERNSGKTNFTARSNATVTATPSQATAEMKSHLAAVSESLPNLLPLGGYEDTSLDLICVSRFT